MPEEEAGKQPNDQPQPLQLPIILELGRSVPWPALAALGVLTYGLLRVMYGLFYGSFGVRPEEVGYGYADALAHSAAAVLVVFLLAHTLVYVLMLSLFLWSVRKIVTQLKSVLQRAVKGVKGSGWRPLLAWSAHRLAIVGVFVGAIVVIPKMQGRLWWLGIAIGLLLGVLFMIGERIPDPFGEEVLLDRRTSEFRDILRRARRLTPWVLVYSVFVFFGPAPFHAIGDAAAAKNGLPIPASGWLLGLLPPWSAQPANVFWIASEKAPGVLGDPKGRCVMYLGRANDVVVVYDIASKETLRVPSRSVLISIESEVRRDAGCRRAAN